MLDGFSTYLPAYGEATITLTKNGLGISKTTLSKLGYCRYVRLLIDYQGRRMAIVKTTEDDEAKMDFVKNRKVVGVRWNAQDLIQTICRMNGWEIDNGEKYVIPGEFSIEDCAVIFDFTKAKHP